MSYEIRQKDAVFAIPRENYSKACKALQQFFEEKCYAEYVEHEKWKKRMLETPKTVVIVKNWMRTVGVSTKTVLILNHIPPLKFLNMKRRFNYGITVLRDGIRKEIL